ncbi:MAG: NUDIX domain-containing protein [Deltaproteobacteria bacterium]|nr:NUDIX domain-containing protein [Deltaproteobacteria bacterium]
MNASVRERVDWLDESGRVLGTVDRAEMRRRNLLHAVSATLVFHPGGAVYIHRRSPAKDVYPGLWDLCVGGTVVSGERFESNACRELAEELGIRDAPVYPLFRHRHQDRHSNSVIQVFACIYGGGVTWQPEEVVEGHWASEAEISERVEQGLICPDTSQIWKRYLEHYGPGRNFARDIAPGLASLDCAALGAE